MIRHSVRTGKSAKSLLACQCLIFAICSFLAGAVHSATIEPQSISAMEWRNIGPFRGGRVTAVEGVPSRPLTFYMGAPGGGVWRTTDGGTSWNNISDGWFKTGSVGAIAVSPSDPNVIYAGMGEHCVRDVTVSHGDGVYKSTDGGKTWNQIGLPKTRHISSVQIHPENPEIVYVGAQGSPWGTHAERGVYRSKDGGKNWTLVLHTNNSSGVNDLVMDPGNPRILYAAMWEHSRKPWHGYQLSSGGPGSALFKSTDGGDTWQRLTKGFPALVGKFGIAVSQADTQRIYALVEAKPGASGLYVSNDAGENWSQVNKEHVLTQRTAYYMHVVADTQDREVVYVLNAPMLKSIDGGKTFNRMQVPHGDNHDLWIHPEHSDWMIQANDGGVNVSYNGGATWSTQGNQPTAQFYRVNADNQFPYHLYAGQQDNSTVKIKSRTFGTGIGIKDWYGVGGGESAHVAFDPDNPQLIYAGSYQGQITEFDDQTGVVRDIRRYPLGASYRRPVEYPYRFNWNAPIVVSQHDSSVLYHGAQMLLKSTDGGQNWQEISPDLTRNDPQKQGIVVGDFTFEGTAGAMYNTIFYVAESPHAEGELWLGTDDGYIHLTRDGGESWQSITPKGLGEAQINMIELSPHQAGKAYAVVTRYKFDDLSPHIYKTEDFGRSWDQIIDGLPAEDWVRVVREDPLRAGLLYAGSQTSAYFSLDDGDSWSSLQLNLPHVPITDLKVHQDDLLASTEGRAFWILDDLSVLRQITESVINSAYHLYKPAATERIATRGFGSSTGLGKNPPTGAQIYYYFSEAPDTQKDSVVLEILTTNGDLVNRFSTGSGDNAISAKAGLNRFIWNWRVTEIDKKPDFATVRAPISYRVQPGTYVAQLHVGDQNVTREFQVLGDPRREVSSKDLEQKQVLLQTLYAESDWLVKTVRSLRQARGEVATLAKLMGDSEPTEVATARSALTQKINTWLESAVEEKDEHFVDAQHSPSRLDFSMFEALNFVDASDPPLTQGLEHRVSDVRARWAAHRAEYEDLINGELARYNAATSKQSTPAILIAESVQSEELVQ
jgi:photosystem II stability/assembly factor-like uncharacterized protein